MRLSCRPSSLHSVVLLAALGTLPGLPGCGGGEEATPAPEVVVEATPEPQPVVLEPAQLFHLRLDEKVLVGDLPMRSPLDRALAVVPPAGPDAEFLRADGAPPAVADAIEALASGTGPSAGRLALVEWNLRWGERSGRARFWGLCSIPCEVADSFVATAEHFPVDPVVSSLPMFALRPGASSLRIDLERQGLTLHHGSDRMWSGQEAEAQPQDENNAGLLLLTAKVDQVDERPVRTRRELRCASVTEQAYPITEAAEAPPSQVAVLPELPVARAAPMLRAVEGVAEVWPWPEAERFEGGFIARPDGADYGLRFERPESRVLWTPTLAQAVAGKAEFVTHSLERSGGVRVSVSPFPGGAQVLGATPVFEGKVVIASATVGYEMQPRAQEVKAMITRFEETIGLPEEENDEAWPKVLFLSEQPSVVVEGSAGSSPHSFVVDAEPGERRSVERAWARMALGSHAAVRSVAADDLALWIEAQLRESAEDRSVFASVFAEASQDGDIIREWKFRVRSEKGDGSPDPLEFLAFIGKQLVETSVVIRRGLASRGFVVAEPVPPQEVPEEGWLTLLQDLDARGAYRAYALPAAELPTAWRIRVTPRTEEIALSWSWLQVPRARWDELVATQAGRETLAGELSKDQGKPLAAPMAAPVGRLPPSQRNRASSVPTVSATGSRMSPPSSVSLDLATGDSGGSVVLLTVWGEGEVEADIEVRPAKQPKPSPPDAGQPAAPGPGSEAETSAPPGTE
ncbi:MAG: hypothetical protein VX498_05610 [Myxococcota bacterium]|nr:hypothetical protein [Myxococcota bacterium]